MQKETNGIYLKIHTICPYKVVVIKKREIADRLTLGFPSTTEVC